MMSVVLTIVLLALMSPLLLFWGLWCILALLAPRKWVYPHTRNAAPEPAPDPSVKIDVLIPAHNEELLLAKLLESLQKQTAPEVLGRVLVIADFCTDTTAAIARRFGCEVIERDSGPRGKPGALRLGLAHLKEKRAADFAGGAAAVEKTAVLFMDADCVAFPDLLAAFANNLLKRSADGTAGRPVQQSAYLLQSPDTLSLHAPAKLAFMLKNVVRPAALEYLCLPCQLFGTGMLIRYDVLDRLTFADHLTEDLRLSHDLLLTNVHPHYTPRATVDSPFPEDTASMTKQKLRWEGGQFETWRKVPAMAGRLLATGRLRALVSLLDWSGPPVALGLIAWFVLTVAMGVLAALQLVSPWVLAASAAAIMFLATYIAVGVMKISGVGGLWQLAAHAPTFLFWKVAVYGRMLTGRGARTWDRTPRPTQEASS